MNYIPKIGDTVTFVDVNRIPHEAKITQVWNDKVIDVTYVDENMTDQASIAVHHRDERPADAMFWY